ncbi:MAG: ABC transporter permease, partial [Lachnospiraceae bacterium]
MLNLIRMNLFRMVHTKSVIVVFIVLMLFANISSCLTLTAGESIEMAKEMKEGQVEFYEPDAASGDFGIYINTPVKSDGTLKEYVYVYFSISSGLLLLFILIGAVLFFRGDEKNGFIKNIAGQTKHKHNIMLSKLVAVGIYTFVCMFCYMLIGYLTFVTEIALVEGGISFGIKYLPEAIKIFALQYLLHMAFISGLLLITEVTKSTAAG